MVTENEAATTEATAKYIYGYEKEGLALVNLISLGLIAIIAALVIFILLQFGTKPKPVKFELTAVGQVITPKPLSEPGITDAALINWVNEIITKAYSFNYKNMDNQKKILAAYLDARGLETYNNLLSSDENLSKVRSNKLVVSVKPTKTPEIVREGVVDGKYAWQLSANVAMKLENSKTLLRQRLQFDILVWRVPETNAPIGLRVTKLSGKITGRGY